jgi:hypothetical protein
MNNDEISTALEHAVFAALGRKSWACRVERLGLEGARRDMGRVAVGHRKRGRQRTRTKKTSSRISLWHLHG